MPKRGFNKYEKIYIVLVVASLILSVVAGLTILQRQEGTLAVSFIDVGQGDCELIEFPSGKSMLIDCGEKECYEKMAMPYLQKEQIGKVNLALVSHFHSDHAGGILRMAELNAADRIAAPNTESGDDIRSQILKAAKDRNIDVLNIDSSKKLEADSSVTVKVLAPNTYILNNLGSNVNNTSVVLKLSYGETDFLFTGDLEADAEKVLLSSENLAAEVLKVAHHGSKTSSSREFLNAVKPKYAVIEVGEDNRYKHPSETTLKSLSEIGADVLRTDLNGNIKFTAEKSGISKVEVSKNAGSEEGF